MFMKKLARTLALISFAAVTAAASHAATVVRVGVQADNPGTTYLDESGKITGYEVEVLNEVFKRLPGYQLDYKTMDFATLFVSLSTNKVDLITSNIKATAEREKQFLFTKEDFYRTPYKLVVSQADGKTRSFADLQGKKIAVLGTGIQAKVLNDYIAAKKLNIEVLPSKSNTEMVSLLTSGRVEGLFLPEHQAIVFNKFRGTSLRLVGNGLIPAGKTPEDFGAHFLVQKGNPELRDKVDVALRELRKDGTLKRLSIKWFDRDLTENYPLEQ